MTMGRKSRDKGAVGPPYPGPNPSGLCMCGCEEPTTIPTKTGRSLHGRQAARDACGNPSWLTCWHCKRYDSPASLIRRGKSWAHRECDNAYSRR